MTMVRNFTTWNSLPPLPTLICRNSAGPGLVVRISAVMTSMGTASTRSARPAPTRSNRLLASCLAPRKSGCSTWSSGIPATGLMLMRGPATSMSAGATNRSVRASSRPQASLRSAAPSSSGQARIATASAFTLLTTSATSEKPPSTGTPSTSTMSEPEGRQAATTVMP